LFYRNYDLKKSKLNFALILIPLVVIALAFSKSTVDVVLLPKYLIYSFFILVITVLAYFASKKDIQIFNCINGNVFFKVYLFYCLISAFSLINTNNFPDGIFELLKIILFGIGIYSLTIYFFKQQDYFLLISKSITVLNFIIVAIGIFQFFQFLNYQNVNHSSSYLISATFGHKNIFSEMVFMTFPLSIFSVFYGNKFWKYFSFVSCLLSIFLITVTLTRAVWLSTLLGFLLSYSIYTYLNYKEGLGKKIFYVNKKLLLLILAVFGSVAIGIFIYSKFDSFTTFKKQAISISGFKYGSGGERIELWKKSIKVFKESPVFGSGIGSWKINVLKYGHKGLESEDNRTFHQRPHNDFIWILCEQGILGLFVYLFFTVIILYYLVKQISNQKHTSKRMFYFLCLYTFLGYLIFSFFSFPKERIEHQLVLLFIFSAVIIENIKLGLLNKSYSQTILLLFIFFVIIAFYVGLKRYLSEIHLQKAYTARNENNWQQVISEIRKAENIFYKIDPMCTPLVWYSGSSYYNLGEKEIAFMDFLKAYELNPNHIHVLNNLATCYENRGDHENAIKYYTMAINISPSFTEAKLNLVATLFNANKKRDAYLNFSKLKYDSTNAKYLQMIPILLQSTIVELANKCKVDPLKYQILAVSNVPDWSSKIFMKSKENNISFEQQVVLDAIFSLDNSDKVKYFNDILVFKKSIGIKSHQ
jgi:O-antigen ligase